MPIEADSHGRLYLPADLRDRYGDRFHVVTFEDRIELVPIDKEPLQAVRDAAGDAFEGESAEALRATASERAREEATADLAGDARDASRDDGAPSGGDE